MPTFSCALVLVTSISTRPAAPPYGCGLSCRVTCYVEPCQPWRSQKLSWTVFLGCCEMLCSGVHHPSLVQQVAAKTINELHASYHLISMISDALDDFEDDDVETPATGRIPPSPESPLPGSGHTGTHEAGVASHVGASRDPHRPADLPFDPLTSLHTNRQGAHGAAAPNAADAAASAAAPSSPNHASSSIPAATSVQQPDQLSPSTQPAVQKASEAAATAAPKAFDPLNRSRASKPPVAGQLLHGSAPSQGPTDAGLSAAGPQPPPAPPRFNPLPPRRTGAGAKPKVPDDVGKLSTELEQLLEEWSQVGALGGQAQPLVSRSSHRSWNFFPMLLVMVESN